MGRAQRGEGRYWFLVPYLVDITPIIDVSTQGGLVFRRRIPWDSVTLEKKSKTKRPGAGGRLGAGERATAPL